MTDIESSAVTGNCDRIAEMADATIIIGSAESLTGGRIAGALSRAQGAGEWFAGGIVAYRPQVKFGLLDVPEGPVVTAEAAEQMAASAAALLGADLVVAVTGEAGPEPQEADPGTVWFGVSMRGRTRSIVRHFDGEPAEVLESTVAAATELILEELGK